MVAWMEMAVERVMAKSMAKPKATLMETATAKVRAKATVMAMARAELTVKVRDRQREGRFAAPADSVASAGLKEYSAAPLVVEAGHSLLRRDLEILPLGHLLLLHHCFETVRPPKESV
jgi:hypothetical protein